ncbi:hypothetical protein [Melittangium boletus]|uniref:Outer membrane protein beta-barrel domain-containing protein n=1 Tax=Melittangium boletus DSM 14713 TaxID=1294270 RepID=A0A250IQ49_9BACT|nr:hypothetical protein [Melittangium boletus]ATB33879.1 hypothetical protein MEBOL_007380 [Melittangium boletus DSM 14713]
MRAPLLYLLLLALPTLAAADPLQVTAVPRQVVLGRDSVVVVRVAVPPDSPPLRATASTGQLTPLASHRPGEAAYSWTPPDIRYPLLAVLAFWVDRPGTPPEVTPLYIPLLGRITLNVDTQGGPGTQVVVQVADTSFGPLPTNRRGRAQVPVEVPPGVHEARVLATSKRQKLRRTIPLDVPPEQPLIALLSPSPLPQEEEGWLVTLGTEPVPGSALRLRVRGASTQEHAPGVFRVKPEPSASAVVVEAKRTDGTATAHASTEVVHAPAVPPAPPPPLVVPLTWEPPPPARVRPTPRPPPTTWGLSLSTHVLAGVFLAGGDNRGPQASLGVGVRLPGLGGRLSLEAEVGVRQSVSHPSVEPLGSLDAQIVALPVLLSARVLAFERGRLSLHGRVGGGAVYYTHRATSSFFDTPLVQRGWTSMGFVAVQAAWRLGAVSPLLELHGAYSLANTPLVDARFGGLSLSVGLRYSR